MNSAEEHIQTEGQEEQPGEEPALDMETVIRDIRSHLDKLLMQKNAHQHGQLELLPEEVARMEFHHTLLAAMETQLPLLGEMENFAIRINQLAGVRLTAEFLADTESDTNAGLFKEPAGSGKTILFGLLASLFNLKTLVLVPKKNLLTQTRSDWMDVLNIPEEDVGLIGGKFKDLDSRPFLISTYKNFIQFFDRDEAFTRRIQECLIIVCDEAHRAIGAKTLDVLKKIGLNSKKGDLIQRLFLAFTATSELISKSVSQHFPYLIAEENHQDMVNAGILVPYIIHKTEKSVIFRDELPDFEDEKVENTILARERTYEKLLGKLQDIKKKSEVPIYAVGFLSSHKECLNFQEVAAKMGIHCTIITGREQEMDKDSQSKGEKALLSGATDIIVTVELLGESWDFPPANAAIMRATRSPRVAVQNAGRVSRSFDSATSKRFAGKLHTPYKKEHAHIIESDWMVQYREASETRDTTSPKVGKNKKRKGATRIHLEKPLDLATALAYSGEDVRGFAKTGDGKPLNIIETVIPDETGRAEHQGEIIMTPSDYAKEKLTEGNGAALIRKIISRMGAKGMLKGILTVKISGKTSIAYKETDLDMAVEEWKKEAEQRDHLFHLRKEFQDKTPWYFLDEQTDEVIIPEADNRTAIGLKGATQLINAFQWPKKMEERHLRDTLAVRHIKPVTYRTGKPITGEMNRRYPAYWKDEIVDQLPKLKQSFYILNPLTQEVSIPEANNRVAISWQGILSMPDVLEKKATKDQIAHFLWLNKVKRLKHPCFYTKDTDPDKLFRITTFWKDEIENLVPSLVIKDHLLLDPVTHQIAIPESNRVVISIDGILLLPHIAKLPLTRRQIEKWIEATLQPANEYLVEDTWEEEGHIVRRPRRGYWMDDLQKNMSLLTELAQNKPALITQQESDGSIVIRDTEKNETKKASTLDVFAQNARVSPAILESIVASHTIQPVSPDIMQRIETGEIEKPLFWSGDLQPCLSLVARDDGIVEIPFLGEKSTIRMKMAMTADGFAKATGTTAKKLQATLIAKGVQPVGLQECVAPVYIEQILKQAKNHGAYQTIAIPIPLLNQMRYVFVQESGAVLTVRVATNETQQERSEVFWVDQMEKNYRG